MSDPIIESTEVIALRAPKYVGDSRIPQLLVLAEEFLGSKVPRENPRNYAKALQVLHWLELSDRSNSSDGGAATGAITSEKEGELKIDYSNAGANLMHYTTDMKADLHQTIWGIELYGFVKRYFVPVATRFS